MTDTITKTTWKATVQTTAKHAVSKVTALVEMEWCKLSSLQDDIHFMRDELKSMHALLAGADDDNSHRGILVREWRDEVRRLSDDIMKCVDDYERRVKEEEEHAQGGNVAAFFRRNTRRVASVGAQHTISNRIKKLKARIHDVSERRKSLERSVPTSKWIWWPYLSPGPMFR
ncbi:unnamed protein product [Urochloa humidicola]